LSDLVRGIVTGMPQVKNADASEERLVCRDIPHGIAAYQYWVVRRAW
jgi:hypothetical protein